VAIEPLILLLDAREWAELLIAFPIFFAGT
jgi:hypothetical protein